MRVIDEREHRRGLVLGLTLAEILVLLLFMLLLALGTRLTQLSRQVIDSRQQLESTLAHLSPLFEELQSKGQLSAANVRLIAEKLSRADDADRQLAALRKENSELQDQAALLKILGTEPARTVREVRNQIQAAARIDPNDPPAVLKRAMDLLEKVGVDADPDQLKATTELLAEKNKLSASLRAAEGERDQTRLQRDNLMRGGRGTTFPSCWIGPDGKTEFIFDVTIRDAGLVVRDAAPPSRVGDKALQLLGPIARGTEITGEQFRIATNKLFAWSQENNCRFFSDLRDHTGPTSKERYKSFRGLVEGHFYIRIASPPAKPVRPTKPEGTGEPPRETLSAIVPLSQQVEASGVR